MMNNLIIDETNFDQYFFDARKHTPKKGQVLVQYCVIAEFVDGPEKRDVINLLSRSNNVIPITQIVRKVAFASELDSYRVPLAIAKDLLSGMSIDKVAEKSYKYTAEFYYYTEPQYIPDDPHWITISLLNLNEFLDRKDKHIRSKIITQE